MAISDLTVTITSKPRPWWRPLSLRAARRWYRHMRAYSRERSRFFRLLVALYLARREFVVGSSVAIP
jgi:hypothetical protein